MPLEVPRLRPRFANLYWKASCYFAKSLYSWVCDCIRYSWSSSKTVSAGLLSISTGSFFLAWVVAWSPRIFCLICMSLATDRELSIQFSRSRRPREPREVDLRTAFLDILRPYLYCSLAGFSLATTAVVEDVAVATASGKGRDSSSAAGAFPSYWIIVCCWGAGWITSFFTSSLSVFLTSGFDYERSAFGGWLVDYVGAGLGRAAATA